jgi:adenylate kinase
LIGISRLLTWTNTPTSDPEQAFTEEDFRRRRSHSSYNPVLALEKSTLKHKNHSLRSYVINAGLLYGEGEESLHYFFKKAWFGQPVPMVGNGKNEVPAIHIKDLSQLVAQVIAQKPDQKYIVAVDTSPSTLESILSCVSQSIGTGQIQEQPVEKIVEEWTTWQHPLSAEPKFNNYQFHLDLLQMNLKIECGIAEELIQVWTAQKGIVETFQDVQAEYIHFNNLIPIKVAVVGPPLSGKSTLAKKIAEYYKCPIISLEDLRWQDSNQTTAHVSIRNQGCVLDGFPVSIDEWEKNIQAIKEKGIDVSISPDFVITVNEQETVLRDRLQALNQSALGRYAKKNEFEKVLHVWKENNTPEKNVVDYLSEQHSSCPIFFNSNFDELTALIGKPHNYGDSKEDLTRKQTEEQITMEKEDERRRQESKEKLQREAELAKILDLNWRERIDKLVQEEKSILETQTVPFREYLMKNILPTLTQGLVQVVKLHPSDPVDFLAQFLFSQTQNK